MQTAKRVFELVLTKLCRLLIGSPYARPHFSNTSDFFRLSSQGTPGINRQPTATLSAYLPQAGFLFHVQGRVARSFICNHLKDSIQGTENTIWTKKDILPDV